MHGLRFLPPPWQVNEQGQYSLWRKGRKFSTNKNQLVHGSPLILQISDYFFLLQENVAKTIGILDDEKTQPDHFSKRPTTKRHHIILSSF